MNLVSVPLIGGYLAREVQLSEKREAGHNLRGKKPGFPTNPLEYPNDYFNRTNSINVF